MTLYWLSWDQHHDAADPRADLEDPADPRPATWPPPEPVRAFWLTGVADDYSFVTIVALVEADSSVKAQNIIAKAWSRGIGKWRFCDRWKYEHGPSERYPVPDWSRELGRWPWP